MPKHEEPYRDIRQRIADGVHKKRAKEVNPEPPHSKKIVVAGALGSAAAIGGVAYVTHQRQQRQFEILDTYFDDDLFATYNKDLSILYDERMPDELHNSMLAIIATFAHYKRPATRQQLCQSVIHQLGDVDLRFIDNGLARGNDKIFHWSHISRQRVWYPNESIWYAVHEEQQPDYPDIHMAIANLAKLATDNS